MSVPVLGGDCRRMAVRDQDASFVGEFLAVAMDILVRAWRARAAKERKTADSGALFSLAPKKVKQVRHCFTLVTSLFRARETLTWRASAYRA